MKCVWFPLLRADGSRFLRNPRLWLSHAISLSYHTGATYQGGNTERVSVLGALPSMGVHTAPSHDGCI